MDPLERISRHKRTALWVGLAFILILGMFLYLFSTWNWGIGISHDSIFYISAAENFLVGNGISRLGGGNVVKPLTHFPPLYPLSLSLLGSFMGVREATDWSAAILFGINAVLIVIIIFQESKSLSAGLAGGLLTLASPLLLSIHFEAMSEPLYLATMLTSILLLAGFLKYRKNWQLILAAVATSLSYLTRYIGVSVLLCGILSLTFLYPGTYRTKFKKVFLYGIIAFVPNLLWYIRNYLLTGSLTNRVLTYHPVTQDKLIEGIQSVSEWVFPGNEPIGLALGTVGFIVLISMIGLFLKFVETKKASINQDAFQDHSLTVLIAINTIVYVVILFASLTFFDISTRLNNRILIPLYVMFLILGVIGIQSLVVTFKFSFRKSLSIFSVVLFTSIVILYIPRSWELIRSMRQDGSGFNSASWRNSEIVAMVKKMDSGVIIYSNEAFPLDYLTGIGAYGIPEKFDPVKSVVRDDYQQAMNVMRERLRNPNSAVVVFHQGYLREGMPTLDEITRGFVIAHESRDGVIFVDPDNLEYWDIQ